MTNYIIITVTSLAVGTAIGIAINKIKHSVTVSKILDLNEKLRAENEALEASLEAKQASINTAIAALQGGMELIK